MITVRVGNYIPTRLYDDAWTIDRDRPEHLYVILNSKRDGADALADLTALEAACDAAQYETPVVLCAHRNIYIDPYGEIACHDCGRTVPESEMPPEPDGYIDNFTGERITE